MEGVFAGIKPVFVAIVVQAVAGLARTAVKSWRLALIGGHRAWHLFARVTEPVLLFAAAAVAAVLAVRPAKATRP
jgi:chromate transport protein ChrA